MQFSQISKCSWLTVITAVLLIVLFQSCVLNPMAWTPPTKPELNRNIAENELLRETKSIEIEGWYGPEDIAIDDEGNIFCSARKSKNDFSDGVILKIDTSGIATIFCNTGSWLAGLHFDTLGNLIACDPERGLIRVDKKGDITILASEDENGNQFLMPNDVDIASDGVIYFSNTSSKYESGKKNVMRIILEIKPDGGLYSYDPSTEKVTCLIDGLFFGNGVAVSQNDDFVLVVELAKYRVLRHWLKGERAGQTEVFLDNLSGIPNGVSRRKDGSFWLGFSTKRNDFLDNIQSKPGLKKFVFGIPLWLQPKQEPFGMIMHLSENGKILKTYYDTSGKFVPEASSIEENSGYLFIGGDMTEHIGKYKLK
jgi:sugar lactone lactonase YvrE